MKSLFVYLSVFFSALALRAADPVVSYVTALQRTGTKLVDVWYGVTDEDGDLQNISIQVKVDGQSIPTSSFSGDIGQVYPSNNLHIVWDAYADWNGNDTDSVSFVVSADNTLSASAVSNMVVVPAGTNSGNDPSYGAYSITNQKTFYMDKFEVTNDQMVDVMQWAYSEGLITVSSRSVSNAVGDGEELLDLDDIQCRITWDGTNFAMRSTYASGYPCIEVTWYGAAAFCNYRSMKEGLKPCYDLNDWSVNTNASGYRLPMSGEWEYAARGGVSGQRFPWGDTINHDYANYEANGTIYYDTSPYTNNTLHPLYYDGNSNISLALGTSPVGSFELGKNGYGIYDMAGNVWEWCNEWYPGYEGTRRTRRGGSWRGTAPECRCHNAYHLDPLHSAHHVGFRTIISAGGVSSNQSAEIHVDTSGPSRVIELSGDLAFGAYILGRKVERNLTIHNSGDASLHILGMQYPSGFSGYWSGYIDPGASSNVVVTFSPAAETNYGGDITVYSDATGGSNLLAVSGMGKHATFNDYDGDDASDMAVFGALSAFWYVRSVGGTNIVDGPNWGWNGVDPVAGDFDGDGISDLAVFDQHTGRWFIRRVSGDIIAWDINWGWPGVTVVSGDFDGDAIDDLAVFDQYTGRWFIRSIRGDIIAWDVNWGWPGVELVSGDFDGDHIADLAVFDQNTGRWFIRSVSGDIIAWNINWGWPGVQPVSGDFDGDGISDLAVFDQHTGRWFIRSVPGDIIAWNINWGWPGVTPISGDFDGDRTDDLAVMDSISSRWYIRSVAGSNLVWGTVWRNLNDIPVTR